MLKQKKAAKANICINALSTFNHLELLEYNASKGDFIHIDSDEFSFDPVTREFADDEERFAFSIRRLYERNKIPFSSPSSLVIPSFFTRQYALPDGIAEEEVKLLLVSEAERFYAFKKTEPEIGYAPLRSGEVLYTAYPLPTLELIKKTFSDLKIPLVSVDCNYMATLRGLVAMGVVQHEITNGIKWGLIIINDSNIFMSIVEGSSIEKISESPVASQEEGSEAGSQFVEMRDDFQQFYSYELISRIVVVNNSSNIRTPALIEGLGFQGATEIFEQNERTLSSLKAQDALFPCTLEAIGGALANSISEVPTLEMADPSVAEALNEEQRRKIISVLLIALGLVIFGIQFGTGMLLSNWTDTETQHGAKLQSEIDGYLSSFSAASEIKRKYYVREVKFQNYKINNLLVRIYKALPPDAWLEDINIECATDLKKFMLTIKGKTMTSDPLNTYVNELNTEFTEKPLLPSIIPEQQEGQRYFSYTLTNSSSK